MVKGGLEDARGLQRILAVLLRTTMDATAEVAAAHEIALETATQNANQEIETLMTVLAATVSSSLSLQNQMVSPDPEKILWVLIQARKQRKSKQER